MYKPTKHPAYLPQIKERKIDYTSFAFSIQRREHDEPQTGERCSHDDKERERERNGRNRGEEGKNGRVVVSLLVCGGKTVGVLWLDAAREVMTATMLSSR